MWIVRSVVLGLNGLRPVKCRKASAKCLNFPKPWRVNLLMISSPHPEVNHISASAEQCQLSFGNPWLAAVGSSDGVFQK